MTTLARALFGSARTEWETPADLFALLDQSSRSRWTSARHGPIGSVRITSRAQRMVSGKGVRRLLDESTVWPCHRGVAKESPPRSRARCHDRVPSARPNGHRVVAGHGDESARNQAAPRPITFVGATAPAPFPSAVAIFKNTILDVSGRTSLPGTGDGAQAPTSPARVLAVQLVLPLWPPDEAEGYTMPPVAPDQRRKDRRSMRRRSGQSGR